MLLTIKTLFRVINGRFQQFVQVNKTKLASFNKTTKLASLFAVLLIVPFGIDKPQPYQTDLSLDLNNPKLIAAPDKTVQTLTAPSRADVSSATRGLNPEAIKSLMKEIAPQYGIDWKLVYAIGYYESGNYQSSLARRNFNFFGRKASSHTWMKFSNPEEAIHNQFAYLKDKYFSRGLDTPSEIGPIYCEGNTWASKITVVMSTLK